MHSKTPQFPIGTLYTYITLKKTSSLSRIIMEIFENGERPRNPEPPPVKPLRKSKLRSIRYSYRVSHKRRTIVKYLKSIFSVPFNFLSSLSIRNIFNFERRASFMGKSVVRIENLYKLSLGIFGGWLFNYSYFLIHK